uniref:Uncharacterized protein n=1 Tax=Arundo donax TaxID=35708 RepID=A0A0A9CBL7_ARUDO
MSAGFFLFLEGNLNNKCNQTSN